MCKNSKGKKSGSFFEGCSTSSLLVCKEGQDVRFPRELRGLSRRLAWGEVWGQPYPKPKLCTVPKALLLAITHQQFNVPFTASTPSQVSPDALLYHCNRFRPEYKGLFQLSHWGWATSQTRARPSSRGGGAEGSPRPSSSDRAEPASSISREIPDREICCCPPNCNVHMGVAPLSSKLASLTALKNNK